MIATNPSDSFYLSYGMNSSAMNVISSLALLSPFLISGLLIFLSIVNSNFIKGFIYLVGILFLFAFNVMLQNSFKHVSNKTNKYCSVFSYNEYDRPYFNSALYAYTISYILFTMIDTRITNIPLIVTFVFFYVLDISVKMINGCCDLVGIISGFFLGLSVGYALFMIIKYSGTPGLLYYDDFVSNKVACSRPKEQQFVCAVYSRGEQISDPIITSS
jgi:hypothetical protein